jgi:effector-binding domain-containing protein
MIDNPTIVQTERQPAAVIRITVPREEMTKVMGPSIEELLAAVSEQDLRPSGPIFSRHFERPGEIFASRVARTVYHGGYEGLPGAWGEFVNWVAQEKLDPRGDLWERYVTGPNADSDPGTWRTELNLPLK